MNCPRCNGGLLKQAQRSPSSPLIALCNLSTCFAHFKVSQDGELLFDERITKQMCDDVPPERREEAVKAFPDYIPAQHF